MSYPFLTPIDLNQLETLNRRIQQLASAPGSPVEGQEYYDTTGGKKTPYFWNGSDWVPYDATKLAAGSLPIATLSVNPLARANHTGTQLAATISDFDTQVRTNRLDQLAVPTAALNLNGQKITNAGQGTLATDLATLGQVQSLVVGLSSRTEVYYATAAALPANTYNNGTAGVGATLTASANGALSVDGVAPQVNDRILVKNEATGANNGIYVVTQTGSGAAPYILTRAVDADASGELAAGILVPVEAPSDRTAGSTNNSKVFIGVAPATVTVGTSSITFTNVGGTYGVDTNGGLQLVSGTNFAVLLPGSSGLTANASGLQIDTAIVTRKFAATIGDGTTSSFTVTHNLNTQDINLQVRQAGSPFNYVGVDWAATTVNTATVTFASPPATNAYRVVIKA